MLSQRTYEIIKGPEDSHTMIGFGSYGIVKLGQCRQTKQVVALKILHSKDCSREIEYQKSINHPNIIRLIDYYTDKQKNLTYMVLQYADNGTLFQKIKEKKLNKMLIKNIFRQVCVAIDFLHQNAIMHRDIKPENILLNKKYQAKLCDFGFATDYLPRKTVCGTYQYMSPQMILGQPYNYKNDIWALGILLFQMVQGRAPFRGENAKEVLQSMKKPIYFSQKFNCEEISMIKDILRVNPKERPQINQILTHNYLLGSESSTQKLSKSTNNSIIEEQFPNLMESKIKLINVKIVKNKESESSLNQSMKSDRPQLKKKISLTGQQRRS